MANTNGADSLGDLRLSDVLPPEHMEALRILVRRSGVPGKRIVKRTFLSGLPYTEAHVGRLEKLKRRQAAVCRPE